MEPQSSVERRGVVALGLLLVIAGVAAVGFRLAGIDPFADTAENGWPIFIIVPGFVLLGASFVPPAPKGVGFAIAGSIVTTVGLVLLYQQATGHWESWSYAWALVGPGAAGLGLLGYGLIFGQGDLTRAGLRLTAIATVIFVVGFWFFESIYQSGRVPDELETWWPLALIGVGVAVLIGGMVESARRQHHV